MKYLVAFIFCGIFFACANDLDLIEEGNDIPIVYGLLSAQDTAQYLRVEKAFADESISAVDLAMDPSNLYYENARVALIHEATGQEYIFEEVDGNAEGYQREEGIFANAPNTLYKKLSSEINLIEGDSYRLEVLKDDSDIPVTAQTLLVANSCIKKPGEMGLIDLRPNSTYTLQWRGNETLALFDIYFEINVLEKDNSVAGSAFQPRTYEWKVLEGFAVEPDVGNIEHQLDGINFYSFMSGALEKDPKWERVFRDINVIILGGGVELQDYRSVGLANLGITSSQDIPVFTNLSEGRGIFSSITRSEVLNVPLNGLSLDSLTTNALTRDLGF